MAVKKQNRAISKKKSYAWKYRIRWKVMIPFLVLVSLVLYLICSLLGYLFSPSRNQITICGFDKTETLEVMNSRFDASYEIGDYLFYGEHLSLFTADYDPSIEEWLVGKDLLLKNLCTEETVRMTIGPALDQQIDLAKLEPGFYELYVEDDEQIKRLTYDEILPENSFSTIVRNEKVKTVELLSDPELIQNKKAVFDKNYLFLTVEEEKPDKGEIDVFIDPYGNSTDKKDTVDAGQVYHNISENKEIYSAALQLKEKLEDAGLRVAISRDSADETTTLFGEDGRLIKAYDAHAKYYIKLGMNGSPIDHARGLEVVYSAYASDAFAKGIYEGLVRNTALVGSTLHDLDEEHPGLLQSSLVEGKDGRVLYDEYLYVREAGGKGTLAGRKDEKSMLNAFAKENRYGMQAIELNYLYLSNIEDLNYWKENKDQIIEETARALCDALGVSYE